MTNNGNHNLAVQAGKARVWYNEGVNILELFCGTKSFVRAAEEAGHKTFTIDFDAQFDPDLCMDIRDIALEMIPFKPDVIWASPPCTCFSVASIGKHWNRDHTPKTDEAQEALIILDKTIDLIKALNPQYYFIENPRGKMRKMPAMNFAPRMVTVTYCQYGDTRMKPTDIWTNHLTWNPLPICKNGDSCHTPAPRGSRTGTQGLDKVDSAIVPEMLCNEIISTIEA